MNGLTSFSTYSQPKEKIGNQTLCQHSHIAPNNFNCKGWKKSVQYPGNYSPLGFTTSERQFAKVLNITIWRMMAKCWLLSWSSKNGRTLALDSSWRKLLMRGRGSYHFGVNLIGSWWQWWLYPAHVPVKSGMCENLTHGQIFFLFDSSHSRVSQ